MFEPWLFGCLYGTLVTKPIEVPCLTSLPSERIHSPRLLISSSYSVLFISFPLALFPALFLSFFHIPLPLMLLSVFSALALSYVVCLFRSFISFCVFLFLYFSAVIFLPSFISCHIYFALWMKGVSRAGALANSFMRLLLSLVLPFTLCSPFRIPAATLLSQNCILCFSK